MINLREFYQAILNPTVVYFLLLILTRLIGRKLLEQVTFFDFVIGITLGTIGGAFVATEVKGFYVLISAIVMAFLVYITDVFILKSITLRKLIEGEPVIIIQKGKILEKNMSKIRYNQDDLMMQLRSKDVFNISEVEYAILEPDGKLSVLKKSSLLPLTSKDLNILTNKKGLSLEIIRDGKIQEDILNENNLSYEWLYSMLMTLNINKLDDIFIATLSSDGQLYVDFKKDRL